MATPAINSIVKAEQRPDHQDVCAAQYQLRPKLIRSRPFRGERRRETQTEPLRRLMAAVLCEAVDRFERNLSHTSLYSRCEFVEAEFWLFKDQSKALFSFNNVCDFLSLDPQHIRRQLSTRAVTFHAQCVDALKLSAESEFEGAIRSLTGPASSDSRTVRRERKKP